MVENSGRKISNTEHLKKTLAGLRSRSNQVWEDAEKVIVQTERLRGQEEQNIVISSIKLAEDKNMFFVEKARRLVINEYVERFGARDETTRELLIKPETAFEQMYTSEYPSTEFIGFVRVKNVVGVKLGSTMRLLHGKKGEYPIDAAHNFSHPDDWENISHHGIGELSRLAYTDFRQINPDLKKSEVRQIKSRLLKEMTEKAAKIADASGIEELYAVMHDVVRGFFEYEGLSPTPVQGARLIENEENSKLFNQFPLYWRVNPPPRLYRWNVAELCQKSVSNYE